MVFRLFAHLVFLSGAAFAAAAASSTAPDTAAPAIVIGAPAAGGAAAETPQLSGRIVGERYFAANGAFSVGMPKLDKETAAIMDSESFVVFKDQVSVFVMLGAWAMPADQKWELETSSTKEFLVKYFTEYVLRPSAEDCPGIKLDEPPASYLPEFLGGALIAYTLLPDRSVFKPEVRAAGAAPAEPAVAKRGTLVFVRDGHVFAIAIELAERVTKQSRYNLSKETESKVLLERLRLIAAAMEFFPGKTPASAPKP